METHEINEAMRTAFQKYIEARKRPYNDPMAGANAIRAADEMADAIEAHLKAVDAK